MKFSGGARPLSRFWRDTLAWQRRYLLAALAHHHGNVSRTAEDLGIEGRGMLYRTFRRLDITPADLARIRSGQPIPGCVTTRRYPEVRP